MDKLFIPAGCIIEGNAVSIINEGDIVIENDLLPQRIESVNGGIRYIPQSREVICKELSAPRGRLEVQGESLTVQDIRADSATLDVNQLEVEDLLYTEGSLQIHGQTLILNQCRAREIEIRGGDMEGHAVTCGETLILEGRQLKLEQIEAQNVIIRGNLTCKKLVARDGVLVESGQVSIKYLESPKFEAAASVRGIVVIATSKDVKAEGVRGFLHPDELNMLNDASPETINTMDLPPIPDKPPTSATESASFTAAASEPSQPYGRDAFSADTMSYDQTDDFQAEPMSIVPASEDEGISSGEFSGSTSVPGAPKAAAVESTNQNLDPEPTSTEPQNHTFSTKPTNFEEDGIHTPLNDLAQDSAAEEDTSGDFDYHASPDEEEQASDISAFSPDDSSSEDSDESPLNIDNPYSADEDEPLTVEDPFSRDDEDEPLTVEDPFSQDADKSPLTLGDHLAGASSNHDQPAYQMENVVPFAAAEENSALEIGDLPDTDITYELDVAAEVPPAYLNDDDPQGQIDPYLSPSGGESETGEPDYYLPDDLGGAAPLDSQYDIQHLANPIDEENDLYAATGEDFGDDSLPDIASIEDLDSAEDIEVNTHAFDDTMDDMEYPEMADDHTSSDAEVLGEEDLYVVEEIPADNDLLADGEDVPGNEDDLVAMLTEILHQIRAYFPEDNYPNSINQIQRYLEEKRFSLFSKANNKNAVLSSFDKFDHPEISQLARSFFEKLEIFMARQA